MLNLVLFGPPGAGKGTQSANLIEKYQLLHISTGDILRAEIQNKTKLGLEAKGLMDEGLLVPDNIVIGMIRKVVESNPEAKGFIFDGFPRTKNQASELDLLLNENGGSILLMLSLEVSDEELIKRLLLRGKESSRADDQSEEIIRNRIQEYEKKTAPLKEFYKNQNKYISIEGIGTVGSISEKLFSVIDSQAKKVS